MIDHVLTAFSDEEKVLVDRAVERAAEAVMELTEGKSVNEVMQRVNSQKD